MSESGDLSRLPLPKSWPRLVKCALVLVNSMLKVRKSVLPPPSLPAMLHI